MIFGISLTKLLLIPFWFTTQVGSLSRGFALGLLMVFLVLTVTAVALSIASKIQTYSLHTRRVLTKVYRLLVVVVIVGELLVLFRQYNVYVLGARFWWLALFCGVVIWVYRIVGYSKQQSALVEQVQASRAYSKYLPKKS